MPPHTRSSLGYLSPQVYTPLRAVHARQLRLHDRLLRAAVLTLRDVSDVVLLRALRVDPRLWREAEAGGEAGGEVGGEAGGEAGADDGAGQSLRELVLRRSAELRAAAGPGTLPQGHLEMRAAAGASGAGAGASGAGAGASPPRDAGGEAGEAGEVRGGEGRRGEGRLRRSSREGLLGRLQDPRAEQWQVDGVTAEETAEAAAVAVAAAALAATGAEAAEGEEEATDDEGSGNMDEEVEVEDEVEEDEEEEEEEEGEEEGGAAVGAGHPRAATAQEQQEQEQGGEEAEGGRPFGEAIAQLRLIQKLTSPSAKVHLAWLPLLWLQPCASRLQPCESLSPASHIRYAPSSPASEPSSGPC